MTKAKKRRILIAIVIAIPLAYCLAIAWPFIKPPYHYKPTGDELYDRCAELVLEQYYRGYARKQGQAWLSGVLGEDRIEKPVFIEIEWAEALEWEEDFSDDPRYWQLLIAVDLIGETKIIHSMAPSQVPLDIQWINRINALGFADDRTFYALRWEHKMAIAEKATLNLMDQAIATNPDNAYFYYVKSDILMLIGDVELAWGALREGNAAPENYRPLAFPECIALHNGNQSDNEDNRLAAMLIFTETQFSRNYLVTIKQKEHYKEACVCLALGFPIEFSDDYLQRSRRMGQMKGADLVSQAVGVTTAQIILDYVGDECLLLSIPQQHEREMIDSGLRRVYDASSVEIPEHREILRNFRTEQFDNAWCLITREEALEYLDELIEEKAVVAENAPLFNILDPPPLTRWARGEFAEPSL